MGIGLDNIVDIPHKAPFRFVDKITLLTSEIIQGDFYLNSNLDFYKGHYPNNPITPGVILIEIMAQIGLVCFGKYLIGISNGGAKTSEEDGKIPVLASSNVRFRKMVMPDQRVFIEARKKLFKHQKLVCDVKMRNHRGQVLAQGELSGFLLDKA